ncbi:MAG TPA: AIR synthase-related protein [Thermomicrobiales bacterium]|nr:AIR synthase-related protein [Thermomicrobiales bacterium]
MSDGCDFLPIGKLPTELLAGLIAGHRIDDPAVVVGPGIGRDAAAIEFGETVLVVKTDPITFATDAAAQYLVDVNANDLACMGATPRWLLVTALLPESRTTRATVETLFRDLQQTCERRQIALIGGHTEVTAGIDRVILVGQLLGLAPRERLVTPGCARPGDRLLLSKALAIEGTALLARERSSELAEALGQELVDRASALLVDPGISVVADAAAVLSTSGATALHDPTEGGFATGVRELAQASGCGAVVNESLIPVLPETRAIADHFGLEPLGLLASGSLLAAVSPASVLDVEQAFRERGIPFSWVGKLTSPDRGFSLIRDGQPIELATFSSDEVARALSDS